MPDYVEAAKSQKNLRSMGERYIANCVEKLEGVER
jgi:hypothetical protein